VAIHVENIVGHQYSIAGRGPYIRHGSGAIDDHLFAGGVKERPGMVFTFIAIAVKAVLRIVLKREGDRNAIRGDRLQRQQCLAFGRFKNQWIR
jgi:hypothetical protein